MKIYATPPKIRHQKLDVSIDTNSPHFGSVEQCLTSTSAPDAQKRNSMMRHFGEALSDIVMPDLTTAETESSLLIEHGDERILFDTGAGAALRPNAAKLGIDLGGVTRIVLSHSHNDHTGGLGGLAPNEEIAQTADFLKRLNLERLILLHFVWGAAGAAVAVLV